MNVAKMQLMVLNRKSKDNKAEQIQVTIDGTELNKQLRKLLYQSFVLPNLDYCSVVWNPCGVVLSSKIERIQNYSLRLIFTSHHT